MTSPQGNFSEKDFIQNGNGKGIIPFWVWLFILVVVIGLLLQFVVWYWQGEQIQQQPPFFQVTNRQMSLYLWQNPQAMRAQVSSKEGYLPAFATFDEVAMDEDAADDLTIAPLKLLFFYHTWDRLLRKEFSNTPIPVAEFLKFLTYTKIWLPKEWSAAPEPYRQLIPELPQKGDVNLSELPYEVLPLDVRIAFQGWLNYFEERQQIESFRPTYEMMNRFLQSHRNYKRNYWRNLYPNYLKSMKSGRDTPQEPIPEDEMPPFLKQAVFNLKSA